MSLLITLLLMVMGGHAARMPPPLAPCTRLAAIRWPLLALLPMTRLPWRTDEQPVVLTFP